MQNCQVAFLNQTTHGYQSKVDIHEQVAILHGAPPRDSLDKPSVAHAGYHVENASEEGIAKRNLERVSPTSLTSPAYVHERPFDFPSVIYVLVLSKSALESSPRGNPADKTPATLDGKSPAIYHVQRQGRCEKFWVMVILLTKRPTTRSDLLSIYGVSIYMVSLHKYIYIYMVCPFFIQ